MKAKKFLKQRVAQIGQQLTLFCEVGGPEALHNFRVELKKLKAFYLFIEYCDHRFNLDKKFNLHRKIFRRSGRIRDFDVMQELMKKNKINFIAPSTVSDTKKQWYKIKRFCDNSSSYQKLLAKEKMRVKPFIKTITKNKLRKYLLKEEEKAIVLLNSKPIQKKLHKVRKKIKQIMYLSKLDNDFPPEVFLYFDKTQKAIGNWHDKNMLIIELQKATLKKKNKILEKLRKQKITDLQRIERLSKKISSLKIVFN